MSVTFGFNLDADFSVIKRGPKNSYFGYSVTQHQIISETDGRTLQDLILVGAPKANSEPLKLNNTGAIYKCSANTTLENDCTQLSDQPFSQPPSSKDVFDDQWLGVTLQGQGRGQKILTCAHRYQRQNKGLGVCYTLLQTLDFHSVQQPCQGKQISNMHEGFGVCQAGTSGWLTKDDGLVIGAPGSFNWRGVAIASNVSLDLRADRKFYFSPVSGETPSEIPPVNLYSYLGYAVTSGVFDSTRVRYYVAGAPRSNNTGQVVLFTKSKGGSSLLQYAGNQILSGFQDFSGFGYSLLSLDLNQDSYDDLVVGAPFYHEKKMQYGGAIYIYPGGTAINKYTKPIEIKSRKMSDQECQELQCEHARFGFSLAKLGDVNKDGYPDFAVGAPFEGKGAVYIYHGSRDGVKPEAVQRIYAKDVPSSDLRGFGHSLASGLDLDGNGYEDLLVGSFESNQVALIRTRPLINLISNVTASPEKINLTQTAYCAFDGASKRCIRFNICLSFTAEPKDRFTSTPTVIYKIEADKDRSILRVEMKSAKDNKRETTGEITLHPQSMNKEKCETEIAYLKDTFRDKLNPLQFTLTYMLKPKPHIRPTPGQPLDDINDFPLLSSDGGQTDSRATSLTELIDFAKECGDDNKCESNLQFVMGLSLSKNKQNDYVLSMGEDESFNVTIQIENLGEAAYLTLVYLEKSDMLGYETTVTLSATDPDTNVNCEPIRNKTMIECSDIGNPLPSQHQVTFVVMISSKRLSSTAQDLVIKGHVNTSSSDKTPSSNMKTIPFRLIIKANMVVSGQSSPDTPIIYGGNVVGESAIFVEDEIGPAINHTYVVSNLGPGTVGASRLVIYWPYEVENGHPQGKHLLYLMQEPQVSQVPRGSVCSIDSSFINPANIEVNPSYVISAQTGESLGPNPVLGIRTKRQASLGETRVRRDSNGDVILGCKKRTAKCHKIVCDITALEKNDYVTVIIRSRLWKATLIQDYMRARKVKIRSRAELTIDPGLNIVQPKITDDYDYAITEAIPDVTDAPSKPVAWWIILVAVLAGMLFLGLIILILWRLGFFKRKKPEDMATYEAKLEKKKDVDESEAMLT